jgi:hypothetical protein
LANELVRIELRRPFRDGTVAVDLDPLSLLCRLVAMVPAPHSHTVHYAGVLGAASKWRALVVPPPPVALIESSSANPEQLPLPQSQHGSDGAGRHQGLYRNSVDCQLSTGPTRSTEPPLRAPLRAGRVEAQQPGNNSCSRPGPDGGFSATGNAPVSPLLLECAPPLDERRWTVPNGPNFGPLPPRSL